MMNVIEQQNALKGLADEDIQKEIQQPTGNIPLYLVLGEARRRQDMRNEFKARIAKQGKSTVAEDYASSLASGTGGAQPPSVAGGPGGGDRSPLPSGLPGSNMYGEGQMGKSPTKPFADGGLVASPGWMESSEGVPMPNVSDDGPDPVQQAFDRGINKEIDDRIASYPEYYKRQAEDADRYPAAHPHNPQDWDYDRKSNTVKPKFDRGTGHERKQMSPMEYYNYLRDIWPEKHPAYADGGMVKAPPANSGSLDWYEQMAKVMEDRGMPTTAMNLRRSAALMKGGDKQKTFSPAAVAKMPEAKKADSDMLKQALREISKMQASNKKTSSRVSMPSFADGGIVSVTDFPMAIPPDYDNMARPEYKWNDVDPYSTKAPPAPVLPPESEQDAQRRRLEDAQRRALPGIYGKKEPPKPIAPSDTAKSIKRFFGDADDYIKRKQVEAGLRKPDPETPKPEAPRSPLTLDGKPKPGANVPDLKPETSTLNDNFPYRVDEPQRAGPKTTARSQPRPATTARTATPSTTAAPAAPEDPYASYVGIVRKYMPDRYDAVLKAINAMKGDRTKERRHLANMALVRAGLGMMASKSPHFGVAVGEGGLKGLDAYSKARTGLRGEAIDEQKLRLGTAVSQTKGDATALEAAMKMKNAAEILALKKQAAAKNGLSGSSKLTNAILMAGVKDANSAAKEYFKEALKGLALVSPERYNQELANIIRRREIIRRSLMPNMPTKKAP